MSRVTQRDIAMRLVNRSARLMRLIELEAPQIIIENERKLIANALQGWVVVDADAHAEADKTMTALPE